MSLLCGRGHRRFCGSPMARVTGNVRLAVGELGVNILGHRYHEPGDVLVVIFVAGEVTLDVAEGAFDAQRTLERHHGGHEFGGGQ